MPTAADLHSRVRPLVYEGGVLTVLDQTRLPSEAVYLALRDAAAVEEAIVAMRVRGAPAIGLAAAYGVAVAARAAAAARGDVRRAADEATVRLERSRPTAVNLRWAMESVRARLAASGGSGEALARELEDEAHRLHRDDAERCAAIARHGASLLDGNVELLTHCNTGALATGGIGTALGIVRAVHAAGRLTRVWMDETRPFLQGSRLTAWELAQDGIPATLLADGAAAFALARGAIAAVVVGADRITTRGDVANKIGTYGLAIAAQAHRVPLYVAAPESTLDPLLRDGADIPIEERSAREVAEFGGVRVAPDGVAVWNPVFDVTPARLVTAIVTERGVHRPPYDFGPSR